MFILVKARLRYRQIKKRIKQTHFRIKLMKMLNTVSSKLSMLWVKFIIRDHENLHTPV